MTYAPHPAETAPQDGRVIRGWFALNRGYEMIAVRWSKALEGWVDLKGEPVPVGAVLKNWSAD